ncbi:transglycosylase domain-containing protein [Aurantiacibacter gangjinensis]|uniref:Penicillin-binding protein n=1 Tax=Aurantiacibacter gangjinensis TaxID=502682 RepID=A0A0G9MM27_9SPHN|nr:PBP1A family penicillin-binding protein [Aurantiacibacter gangjinensis]APE27794.1 Multimodular transpeptidase-transglycosylase [Aurantiacibacter gangjinensis]KLE31786.1 penicillin-binding protein [Aurantiacibacter gangjinensis]
MASDRKRAAGGWKAGLWKWTKRLAITGTVVAILAAIGLATAVYFASRSLPSYASLRQSQHGQTILVRARDGSEIVELGPSYGEWLDSDEIPDVMKNAMISVEDHRFYSHWGVDPVRLTGAIVEGITGDDRIGGTSTITQQLARNVFLNSNRTLDRKLREAVLALALEWRFSKDQILELYLNKVYFGGGSYGIDSASRKFFSHSARELTLEEAAIIAGLVKAPSRYAPTASVENAVSRANVVIGQMVRYGDLDPAVAREVDVSAVNLRQEVGQNSIRYFTDWALPQLDLLLPNETFEPIEVWTTLDVGMQRAATTAVQSNAPDGAQGALVSVDRDGAILALVGGTDYVTSNYNRATDALRQPGSAWKLFVFLAALEAGYTPDDRVQDVPVTINDWTPRNSGGRYAGEMDLRSAFAYSKNSVAAQLGNEVGFSNVASMARRFGITTPISTYPAMVLGTSEVRLLDMTRAFAAVSAGGQSVEPYGILRVTTPGGEEIYRRREPRSYQLVPDYVAAGITDLLQSAVATGTGRAAQIGRPVAGKTGTTNSNRDGYFVGFSSGITTGVWMGRDDNGRVGALQGGTAPARAFSAYMRYAVRERPVEEFDTDLQLPEWQLEPDDEFYFGEDDDYYFYIDEQGNLVEPRRDGGENSQPGFDVEGEGENVVRDPLDPRGMDRPPQTQPQPQATPRRSTTRDAPPAASDDFLERATGRDMPDDRERQRKPERKAINERRI